MRKKNFQNAYNSIFRIENGLLRQKARFFPEWIKKGYFMVWKVTKTEKPLEVLPLF